VTDRTLTYRPGSWLGIVGENATVLLPGSEKARAGALWALVDDGGGFDAVLDALVAGGLSGLPGFVLLAGTPETVRVLVRGEATATFETDTGQIVVSADPGAMWAEQTVSAQEFAITLPDEAADGPSLAVTDGLVRLGSLETPTTASPLAPVVQLAPVPPASAPIAPAAPTPPAPVAPPVAPVPLIAPVPPVPPVPTDFLADPLHGLGGPGSDADQGAPEATGFPADEQDDDADELLEAESPETDGFGSVDSAGPEEVDEDDLATDIFAAVPEPAGGLDDFFEDDGADAATDEPADLDDAVTDEQDAIAAPLGAPPAWTPEPPSAPPVGLPPAPPAPPLGLVPDLADSQLTEALVPPAPPTLAAPVAPVVPESPAPPTTPPAHLTFSHGAEIDVAGLIVIGRNPDAGRFPPEDQPFVVTVPSPHSEISSTHAEIRPGTGEDLGRAVVTDLGSTNGTLVVQPGQRPEELRAGVPVVLASGALVDLGDGLTIRVR
jgi:hypothetical protein